MKQKPNLNKKQNNIGQIQTTKCICYSPLYKQINKKKIQLLSQCECVEQKKFKKKTKYI